MSEELLHVKGYSEISYFAECPYCGNTNPIGCRKNTEEICLACFKPFVVDSIE